MFRIKTVSLCSALLLAALSCPVQGVVITDGSLSVDITSDARFQIISLNATPIDLSTFVQEQHANNGNVFAVGSPVVAVGPVATYTTTQGVYDVAVTSRILGPLASNPATTNVLEQEFVFTNTSGSAATLESVSFVDPDINGTVSNTVAFDTAQRAVYATAGTQLMAAIANESAGTLAWEVGDLSTVSVHYAGLENNLGPVGPFDVAMSIGLDAGTVGPGQSATLTYRYLFSTNLSSVPSDFVIPEPGSLLLAAMGLAGFVWRRGRS